MRTLAICLTLTLVLTLAAGIAVFADTSIYTGQPAADTGITLFPWGSGNATESAEKTLAGTRTIKIETGGWFEGGGFEFATPAAIPSGGAGSADYLVFTVSPTMQNAMSTDSTDVSWYTRGAAASARNNYDLGAQVLEKPKIMRVRLVFADASGKKMEVQPTPFSTGETGWVNLSIPVAKLRAASIDSIKRVFVFSDVGDTIYIGEIKVAQDTSQLKAESVDDLSYATGDVVPFAATVTSGLSDVKCSWDFDKKDGIQEDAIGSYVTHVFNVSGDYVVTLTVTDNNGIKSPYSMIIKVHIE